jgi:hypothetical protein
MKMTAFWDIAPCSLVNVDRRFRSTYSVHNRGDDGHDGGSPQLRNVGLLHRDYVAPQKAVIFITETRRLRGDVLQWLDGYAETDNCLRIFIHTHKYSSPIEYNTH